MSPRNQNLLGVPVDARLIGYATLAGAALAAPSVADAAIVWSGPVAITIPSTTAGVYLNVVTGVNNVSPGAVPGWDLNPWSSTSLNFFTPTPNPGGGEMVGAGSVATVLAFGTPISGASTFTTPAGTSTTSGTTLNSSNNLFGFRFINEAAGNAIMYGWLRISLSSSASAQPRLIVEYAYENTGGAIPAGAIPEPTTIALFGVMAAGALGVRAWRKRKAA
jgi:PEP-CTERM motif